MNGVRIAHIPNAQRKVLCFKNQFAMGPPTQTVTIYGEEANANMSDLFLRDEVSATKMEMT